MKKQLERALSRLFLSTFETSMRSPRGWSGWLTRRMMKQANSASTAVGLQRLGLTPSDTLVELGAAHGAGVQYLFGGVAGGNEKKGHEDPTRGKTTTTIPIITPPLAPPKRVVLVEISPDFRRDLRRVVEQLPDANVEIHGDDCRDMRFLSDASVDHVFGMNVVYFLHPLPEYLAEFHRVLQPHTGTLVFACKFKNVPKEGSAVFFNTDADTILQQMDEAGFDVSRETVIVSKEQPLFNYVELKGVKR